MCVKHMWNVLVRYHHYSLLSHFLTCIMVLPEHVSVCRPHTNSVLVFKPKFTHKCNVMIIGFYYTKIMLTCKVCGYLGLFINEVTSLQNSSILQANISMCVRYVVV